MDGLDRLLDAISGCAVLMWTACVVTFGSPHAFKFVTPD